MPKRKAKFTPKKKKTLVPEPNWTKLSKAKTEEAKLQSWKECEDYVHYEVTDREQIHSMKKWVRDISDWDVNDKVAILPDTFLTSYAKHGWKAIRLGWMPDAVLNMLTDHLLPIYEKAETLHAKMNYDHSIHPSLMELDEDAELHPTKVKQWIKYWNDYIKSNKKMEESNDWKQRLDYQTAKNYVSNMNSYLKSSIWVDSRFGQLREKKITQVCVVPAYDRDGLMKRTVGVYYPDIGQIWNG